MGANSLLDEASENELTGVARQLDGGENGSALHSAAKNGQALFIEAFIEQHGKNLDLNERDQAGRTPLFLAADNGHVSTIKVLLKHNARVDIVDKRNRNALHYAVESGCVEACEVILDNAQARGCSADLINKRELYLGSDQCFLVRGRDNGVEAWHYVAVDRALLTVFQQVITGGQVDVGKFGKIILSGWGSTPSQDVTESMKKRYDPTEATGGQPDLSPFHYAILRRNVDLARKMLDYGADLNVIDSFGLTALHLAAMRGQLSLLIEMESRGAMMEARDDKDRRPLEVAEANKQKDVVNYLESATHVAQMKRFLDECLSKASNCVEAPRLDSMRREGKNVKAYIVNQLRDLEARIHDMLFDMGTTPVMQATQQLEGAAAAAPS